MRILLAFLLMTVTTGAMAAPPPAAANEVNCAVTVAGNSVTQNLLYQMDQEVTRNMRGVMGLFDMSCLSNIINFGGFGFFNIGGDWLGSLRGALCNAIKDWLTATDALYPVAEPDPTQVRLETHLAAIRPRGHAKGAIH